MNNPNEECLPGNERVRSMILTWVSHCRLHGVPLPQKHLDERGGDVPVASGDARRLPPPPIASLHRHRLERLGKVQVRSLA